MTIVRNCKFSVYDVRKPVLLHARIKVDLDHIATIFLKCKLFDRTTEGLINLKIDSCRKWTHILDA